MTLRVAAALALSAICLIAPAAQNHAAPDGRMDMSFARFRVVGSGHDQAVAYTGGPNSIRCQRDAGWADLWIRFAERPDRVGDAGPHLDIDLCSLGSGGTFTPMDPKAAKCPGGQTWAVWWHAGGATFVSGADSQACSLTIVRKDTVLTGTFGCRGLADPGGSGSTLDVVDGSSSARSSDAWNRRPPPRSGSREDDQTLAGPGGAAAADPTTVSQGRTRQLWTTPLVT